MKFAILFVTALIMTSTLWAGSKPLNNRPLPKNAIYEPFWLATAGEFKNFRSTKSLPRTADFVIIGAGLTGSSAAYHLMNAVNPSASVVLLEAGEQPGSGASGRNGGNFQLLPENYIGRYNGMVEERAKWLRTHEPDLSDDTIQITAEAQAKTLYQFCLKNFIRFLDIIQNKQISCDFSSTGWLKMAGNKEEERALQGDIEWLNKMGHSASVEHWPAERIRNEIGIPTKYSGRRILGNGNYHPYKFINSMLKIAVEDGLQIYTKVRVTKIVPRTQNEVVIETSEGPILAGKVIIATNAYTAQLLPELWTIETRPSQILTLENVRADGLQGMTITEHDGDIYYNFPHSTKVENEHHTYGTLLFGLDWDQAVSDPGDIKPSRAVYSKMRALIDKRFPETIAQQPSRMWVGPMAFTPDRVPVIGFYHSKKKPDKAIRNVVISAGFQGYGGSYCIHAGYVAVRMAITGTAHPDAPEEMFSPKRFL